MIPARIKQHASNAKAHAKRIASDAKYPGTFSGLVVRWVPVAGGVAWLVAVYAR